MTDDDDAPLGATAFVAVEDANCFFQPDTSSAVRLIPPHATEIEVVETEGSWVRIRWVGKLAWTERTNLSAEYVEPKERVHVNIVPAYSPPTHEWVDNRLVHTGKNGGRYVYTDKGYRRYI